MRTLPKQSTTPPPSQTGEGKGYVNVVSIAVAFWEDPTPNPDTLSTPQAANNVIYEWEQHLVTADKWLCESPSGGYLIKLY